MKKNKNGSVTFTLAEIASLIAGFCTEGYMPNMPENLYMKGCTDELRARIVEENKIEIY